MAKSKRLSDFLDALSDERLSVWTKLKALVAVWRRNPLTEFPPMQSPTQREALSHAIHAREVSCREVMQAYLPASTRSTRAQRHRQPARRRRAAAPRPTRCDAIWRAAHARGWLHGMPQAIKDLAPTAGMRTTNGSPLLRDNVPARDGLMVQRMKAAGCIVIGKTNAPEFGLGSHTFNEVFGPTHNAYDPSRTAGGSSGGAAVSLAHAHAAGGRRQRLHGLPAQPGRLEQRLRLPPEPGPRAALAGGRRLRHAARHRGADGPHACDDVALLLDVQAGYDPRAPLSLRRRSGSTAGSTRVDARRVRIGWLGDLDGHLAMEPGVLDVCEQALRATRGAGCAVEPIALGYRRRSVWEAWLVWRRWLVAGRIAPFLPTRRTAR